MTEWKKCTLGDLGQVVGGATPSTKNESNYNGDIAWITPKDLSNFSGRYISKGERNITQKGLYSCSTQMLPKNSVLFSSRAPIGYVAIAKNELCTNQGFKSIVPNSQTHYLFLYYLLKYNKNNIENMGSGTTFKEVSGSTMRNIEVCVPIDYSVQKSIADILGSIDDKIEENERINKNLEQQVSLVYDTLLSDCNIALQEIALGDIAEISSGKRPPMRSNTITKDANIPLIGASSVMGYTNEANHCDTILVTGRVGTHGIVQRLNTPCWTSDNTLVITSKYYEFIYQILQRIDYQSMNRGSTQPLITQGDMKKVVIKLPDTHSLNEFENFASTLMKQREANLIENTVLAQARDTLLPRLMSGEIDVSDIDI